MKARMSAWSSGVVAVAALCFAAGCDNSTEPRRKDTGPVYLARTSPENLLENLKLAYVNRDLAPYDSLFASDFEFYFSVEDQYIAEKLIRSEEITVHESMFSSTEVRSITVSFAVGSLTVDTGEPDLENPGQFLRTLTATNVDLMVVLTHDGQTMTYQMLDGTEQFWFREEAWTDSHGNRIWTIVKWRELDNLPPNGPARPVSPPDVSWGQLKSLFL